MEAAATPGARPSRWAPFRYAAFRHTITARALSTLGDWMQNLAAGWLMFRITHSAAAVGAITLVGRGPGFAMAAYGGVLADRYGERRMGIRAAAVSVLAATALTVAALAHAVSPAWLYATTFVIGSASAISKPLMQDIVPQAVPAELITPANALNATTNTTARMVGPLIGGGLVVAFGVSACFAANTASFVVMLVLFATLPREIGRARHAKGGIRPAVRAARSSPLLTAILLAVGAVTLLVAPVQELAPAIAHRYGGGAHIVGFLLGALAGGGVLGTLIADRFVEDARPRRYTIAGISTAAGLLMVALGFAHSLAVALVVLVGIGVCLECLYVSTQIGLEVESPAALVGREMGLYYMLIFAGLAIGAPAIGGLFDLTTVTAGLAIAGGVMIAFAVWRIVRVTQRRRDRARPGMIPASQATKGAETDGSVG